MGKEGEGVLVLVCYQVSGQWNTEAIDHHAGKNGQAVQTSIVPASSCTEKRKKKALQSLPRPVKICVERLPLKIQQNC